MSIQQIIKEALEKSPLGVKEAVQEELRIRVAEAISAKMEEVEQLDEISKKTAQNYLHKSRRQTGDYFDKLNKDTQTKDDTIKFHRRLRGQRNAIGKLSSDGWLSKVPATEEFDLSDYTLEELEDFMMSEDFEQLDEISKKTLASYVKKASADATMKSGKAEYEAGRAHDATYGGESPDHGVASRWRARSDKSSKTASNRLKGISRATDRLAK